MIRGFQWDLARQVERLDWLLAQLPKYSAWGYNELHLHLEDAVDYPSLPGVARRDAYSWRQFERLVAAADRVGIKTVPIVNLLGHTQYLIKTEAWRDLNELRAPDGAPLPAGQICPSHPRTQEVAERLMGDVAPYCTAGKIHVGLDESFLLGRHPRARAEVEAIGLARYFARYATRLHDIAARHRLRTALWADMLALLPEAIDDLPPGLVAYDWYYYAFGRTPRLEAQNFRAYDLVPKLRAQGISYWGCPMNGAFRHEPMPVFGDRIANAQSWWRRCEQTRAEGFLVTGWEPNRLALETTVVVDAAIASLWLNGTDLDQVSMLQRGLERVHGKRHARERARQLFACDERAFSGYARWETHHRWDSCHGRDGATAHAADVRFFTRTLQQKWPAPLAASLRWRRYLAQRDVLIREQAQWVQRGRRLLHRERHNELAKLVERAMTALGAFSPAWDDAQAAAKAMWRGTRRPAHTAPNLEILKQDRKRLQLLKLWWRRVQGDVKRIRSTSPVFGRWQLRLLVHTTHPNLQAIAIETQSPDGTWTTELQRYLIEFRNHAARRRSRIRHWIGVPLETAATPVRIALRGLGAFAVSDVHLTDGVTEYRPTGRFRRVLLGNARENTTVLQVNRAQNRAAWEPKWVARLQR